MRKGWSRSRCAHRYSEILEATRRGVDPIRAIVGELKNDHFVA